MIGSENIYRTYEYLGVVSGLIYLAYVIYQRRECWIFYILSAVAYLPVMANQGMYLYAAMQVLFAAGGIYGWWTWGKSSDAAVVVHRGTKKLHVIVVCLGFLAAALLTLFLRQLVPVWNAVADALISVFSLLATILTARKLLESWQYWIAVNIVATAVYAAMSLIPTSFLYAVYLVFSIYGYREWKKAAV